MEMGREEGGGKGKGGRGGEEGKGGRAGEGGKGKREKRGWEGRKGRRGREGEGRLASHTIFRPCAIQPLFMTESPKFSRLEENWGRETRWCNYAISELLHFLT